MFVTAGEQTATFDIPSTTETICGRVAICGSFLASFGSISGGLYNILLANGQTYYTVIGWIFLIVGCCLPCFLCYQKGDRRVDLHEDRHELHYVEVPCCGFAHPTTSYLGTYHGATNNAQNVVTQQSTELPQDDAENVQKWMADTVKLPQYTDKFVENGFDSVQLFRHTSMDDLDELMNMLNVTEEEHRGRIKDEVAKLQSAYEKLMQEKDDAIAAAKASGMAMAKSVLASL